MIVLLSLQCTRRGQSGLAAFDFDMETPLRRPGRPGEQGRLEEGVGCVHCHDSMTVV
jgi:hypothetical protein